GHASRRLQRGLAGELRVRPGAWRAAYPCPPGGPRGPGRPAGAALAGGARGGRALPPGPGRPCRGLRRPRRPGLPPGACPGPAALGCTLALGWPMPDRVLALHAAFRCLTSGLLAPGDYDLPAALGYFELDGDGVDGLARLLAALEPNLDLPRALLRGRYTAAVARMERVGVPIDVEALDYLRAGCGRRQH